MKHTNHLSNRKDERHIRKQRAKALAEAFIKQSDAAAGQYWGGQGAKDVAKINRSAMEEE